MAANAKQEKKEQQAAAAKAQRQAAGKLLSYCIVTILMLSLLVAEAVKFAKKPGMWYVLSSLCWPERVVVAPCFAAQIGVSSKPGRWQQSNI